MIEPVIQDKPRFLKNGIGNCSPGLEQENRVLRHWLIWLLQDACRTFTPTRKCAQETGLDWYTIKKSPWWMSIDNTCTKLQRTSPFRDDLICLPFWLDGESFDCIPLTGIMMNRKDLHHWRLGVLFLYFKWFTGQITGKLVKCFRWTSYPLVN